MADTTADMELSEAEKIDEYY